MTGSHRNPEQLLDGEAEPGDRIVRVDATTRLDAVERLMSAASGGLPGSGRGGSDRRARRLQADRFLAFSAANGIDLDAMWARLDDSGRVSACVLAVPNPGRTAILFLSSPRGPAEIRATGELIDHVCGQLRERGVHLAQALLDPRDAPQREALLAGGFIHLAHLGYMECPLPPPRRPPPQVPPGISFETYREELRSEVRSVLDASYEETLDCPGLRGLRDTDDILAGHRGTGEFDPDLWTIMRRGADACGVLLLNRSPASNTIELVYIGLARAERGRGLGRCLLVHGLQRIASRPERAVTLAVDERNTAAITLYRTEGFRRVLRRDALVRSLRIRVAEDRDADSQVGGGS